MTGNKRNGEQGTVPFVFVVGCPRSGTTLLQRMLNNHPRLAVANDTHFIPRALSGLSETNPKLGLSLVKRVRSYHRFPRLGLSDNVVDKAALRSSDYREFVTALYTEYAHLHKKDLAGEKTPDYCRHLPLLHGLFPWAKSVHIIRDGRDVTLSTLQWAHQSKGPGRLGLWKKQPVAVCALWWKWQVSTGRRDGERLGRDRYNEVKYEVLTRRPDETLREISRFLRLPFAPEMANFHAGRQRARPGLSAKKAWLPATPGLRDWRTQMDAKDIELFEAIGGDLLEDLGYTRSFARIAPAVSAVASQCVDWWNRNHPRA